VLEGVLHLEEGLHPSPAAAAASSTGGCACACVGATKRLCVGGSLSLVHLEEGLQPPLQVRLVDVAAFGRRCVRRAQAGAATCYAALQRPRLRYAHECPYRATAGCDVSGGGRGSKKEGRDDWDGSASGPLSGPLAWPPARDTTMHADAEYPLFSTEHRSITQSVSWGLITQGADEARGTETGLTQDAEEAEKRD
jgi:hypothetical protein